MIRRLKCWLGFHTWGALERRYERQTSLRSSIAWYSQYCIHCEALKEKH